MSIVLLSTKIVLIYCEELLQTGTLISGSKMMISGEHVCYDSQYYRAFLSRVNRANTPLIDDRAVAEL